MILRQLFHQESASYTYIVGDALTRQSCIIDPVRENTHQYLQLLKELNLELVLAMDTHVHADHITALGVLREMTGCKTMVGADGDVECASNGLYQGQLLAVGNLRLKVLYTPGHTADSYCFLLSQQNQHYLFSGDTLLIRGTGRTDFQNGDAGQLYDSIHQKLLALDPDTIVFPGHDYKGWSTSTIAEEKQHNPRLQIQNKQAFIEHMNALNLPDPKLMDIAVPANLMCGRS